MRKKLTATRRQVFLGIGATVLIPLPAEAAANAGAKAGPGIWMLGDDIEKFFPGMRAKILATQRWFTVEEVREGWDKQVAEVRAYRAWQRGLAAKGGGAP
jgi:hypothetical protein